MRTQGNRCLEERSGCLHRRDETVATPGQRLDEARRFSDVAERGAKFPDGVVDALFEVDERLAAPERMLKVVARNDFPGAVQQKRQ